MDDCTNSISKCGFVAIVGRPNVGKSTLMNRILGQKISITSRKPQTTRQQILGIKTEGQVQTIYVDTPGLHKNENNKAINRYMNKTAKSALKEVDIILFVVDRTAWHQEDQNLLEQLKFTELPVFLIINKIDQIAEKEDLLPYLQKVSERFEFAEIVPISAQKGTHVERLEKAIEKRLPVAPTHHYPEDQVTDRNLRFLVAEMIREKLIRQLGDELPYATAVQIESFRYDEKKVCHIDALILVERQAQKRIVIGAKGAKIKLIGQEARMDMEPFLESKVMLRLWVKVKDSWSDDLRALQSLGYDGLS